jgi:hypothetical protein
MHELQNNDKKRKMKFNIIILVNILSSLVFPWRLTLDAKDIRISEV